MTSATAAKVISTEGLDLQSFSLVEYLVGIIDGKKSGSLQIADQNGMVGQLVFVRGDIAWAVCDAQEETLGDFLGRLGSLTREDLERACNLYRREDGRRRFAAILEDEGLLPRPLLRRSLQLHIRNALELLFAKGVAAARWHRARVELNERFIFKTQEVLPVDILQELIQCRGEELQLRREWRELGTRNAPLRPFVDLDGYLASALVSAEGAVLAAHTAGDVDAQVLAVHAAMMVDASVSAVHQADLGRVDALTLECATGCLICQQIDADSGGLALVLLAHEAKPGSAKLRLRRSLASMRSWLRFYRRRAEMLTPSAEFPQVEVDVSAARAEAQELEEQELPEVTPLEV